MDWDDAIGGWLLTLRAAGRPDTTLYLRRAHLRRFAAKSGVIRPFSATRGDLVAWVGTAHWAPETRRSVRSSLRSFYSWAVDEGHMEESPAERLPTVKASAPHPRPTPEQALEAALVFAEPRERLMVRLAAELGLRRGEVAQVHTRDLLETATGPALLVRGKGDKQRVVPLPERLAQTLRDAPPGYLFPGGVDGHLGREHVGKVVSRLLPRGYSMHTLRHRFGTRAYALSGDLLAVQEILGHASADTTRRYVEVPDEAKRALVERVSQRQPGMTPPGRSLRAAQSPARDAPPT